ncbi:MAG: hypothetical protein KVP17_002021 [Porospora cf. gigantea B]|uniref:uncharacterized protein n=1 Tax=Porospora cf. gigantea B TaxID=2853592 RepID=UPI003571B19F|nr:MAG: hypothetical protein KVP17_002021 [Porospora cf. gigantea B]
MPPQRAADSVRAPLRPEYHLPTFLFVVDLQLFEEELEVLKEQLSKIVSLLPAECSVGLITFGTNVHVHELSFVECSKCYVFRGGAELKPEDIARQLGIVSNHDPRGSMGGTAARRFLMPVSEVDVALDSILDDLQKDSWPVEPDSRPNRCTGAALNVAVSLMEAACPHQAARIMLFTGGVCTVGPGQVADLALSENIRQHVDLQKETKNAKYARSALQYHTSLAERVVRAGHVVDIFAGSLDQVGLFEMKVLCDKTNGYLVMCDSFSMNVFEDSVSHIFRRDAQSFLTQGLNARLEVLCSRDVKVGGVIGCCSSTGKKGNQVGEVSVGEGQTCEWFLGSIDARTTLAMYFELVNQQSGPRSSYLQFQLSYLHPSGRRRLRVITLAYHHADPSVNNLAAGFDQEAAACLVSRLAVYKTETEETLDVLRWIDRKLIRLVSRFADYQKDDPSSFQIGAEFGLYPQFMFHLRRSPFLQTFNASPDESSYYRGHLMRESTSSMMIMIQPSLLMYTMDDQPPRPVLLDVQSLRPDVTLLLDSYFHIVVWSGEQIALWVDAGYHLQPEYAHFKRGLERPVIDAKQILTDRFPVPKYVNCRAGGSQARFLLAKVNPSATHSQYGDSGIVGGMDVGAGSVVLTDDVSLNVFMDHLVKLAVQS